MKSLKESLFTHHITDIELFKKEDIDKMNDKPVAKTLNYKGITISVGRRMRGYVYWGKNIDKYEQVEKLIQIIDKAHLSPSNITNFWWCIEEFHDLKDKYSCFWAITPASGESCPAWLEWDIKNKKFDLRLRKDADWKTGEYDILTDDDEIINYIANIH